MICKEKHVPPPIAIAFPDTPTCRDCVKQLELLFTGCNTEQERMERMEIAIQLVKGFDKCES